MEIQEIINPQVSTYSLPSIGDVDYELLHVAHRKINIISTVLLFVAILIAMLTFFFFVGNVDHPILWQVGIIAWLLMFSLSLYHAIRGYDYMGYALRQKDIIYKNGIWFSSVVVVPFNRVQHCEIEQGPIDRYFGLATLSLYTAGGSSSDLSIHGITLETANGMKSYITQKIAAVDEEE